MGELAQLLGFCRKLILDANNVLVSSVGKGHLSDIFVYGGLLHHMEILHLV